MDDQQSYSSVQDPFGLRSPRPVAPRQPSHRHEGAETGQTALRNPVEVPETTQQTEIPRHSSPSGMGSLPQSPVLRATPNIPLTAGKPTDEVRRNKNESKSGRTAETDSDLTSDYYATSRLWDTAIPERPPPSDTVHTSPQHTVLSQLSESPHEDQLPENSHSNNNNNKRSSLTDRLSARRRTIPQPPRVSGVTATSETVRHSQRLASQRPPPGPQQQQQQDQPSTLSYVTQEDGRLPDISMDQDVHRLSIRYQQLARDLLHDQESTWRRQQENLAAQQSALNQQQAEFEAKVQAWQEEQDAWYVQQEEERQVLLQAWRDEWENQRRGQERAWREKQAAEQADWKSRTEEQEQALRILREKREREHASLQEAIEKLNTTVAQTEQIANNRDEVELQLTRSQQEYTEMKEKLEQGKNELQSLKERIQVFLREDRSCRQSAQAEAVKAQQELDNLRAKATEEQMRLEDLVSKEQARLEGIQRDIAQKQLEWEEEQSRARQEEKIRAEEEQQNLREENDKLVEEATQKLRHLELDMSAKHLQWKEGMEDKTQNVERLQRDLLRATQKYQNDVKILHENEKECERLMDDLNERVARFASSEGREKRLREELENQVERLREEIETQRQALVDQSAKALSTLEETREAHRLECEQLTKRVTALESERDYLTREVEQARKNHDEERIVAASKKELLENELKNCQSQLKKAIDESKQSEDALKELQRAVEVEERARLNSLMSRLESNSTSLEKRLEETETEREDLHRTKQEYQSRLAALDEKERQLMQQRKLLDENERKFEESTRYRQKTALETILKRPWRREQEEMNAAFSKWIRVAMFDSDTEGQEGRLVSEETISQLKYEYEKSEKARALLEETCRELQEQVKEVELRRSVLVSQIEESNEKSKALKDDVDRIRAEKDRLLAASRSSSGGRINPVVAAEQYRIDADKRVCQREVEVGRKEEALDHREHLLNERERRSSEQLEASHSRIRRMAEQLRRKEAELDAKEKELAAEVAQNKVTQERVQELAAVLKDKAAVIERDSEALVKRMKDCDELESQLSRWQEQLEFGR